MSNAPNRRRACDQPNDTLLPTLGLLFETAGLKANIETLIMMAASRG